MKVPKNHCTFAYALGPEAAASSHQTTSTNPK